MRKFWFGLSIATAVFMGTGPVSAAFIESADTTTVSETVNDDVFVAGNDLSITAPIHGEFFGAGKTVTVASTVDRSIFAAGTTVTVKEGAGYNAFVAGQTVSLSGQYGHDVFAAGSTVIIESGTVINGSLYAAGQSVIIHGTINGDVHLMGDTITSDGIIKGSLDGTMTSLSFTGGSIGGDLRYESNRTATGLSTVTIGGTTDQSKPEASPTTGGGSFPKPSSLLMQLLGIMLAGAILILLVPKKIEAISDSVSKTWFRNLGLGILALFAGPLLVGIAFVTVVGWPIGLIILALLIIELYFAGVIGAIVLGRLITRTKPTSWWIALAVGALVTVIGTALPLIGMLFGSVMFLALTLPALGASLTWWKTDVLHR